MITKNKFGNLLKLNEQRSKKEISLNKYSLDQHLTIHNFHGEEILGADSKELKLVLIGSGRLTFGGDFFPDLGTNTSFIFLTGFTAALVILATPLLIMFI